MEEKGLEIIGQIAEQSKRKPSDISRLIEEKQHKFAGLLTESGAAFMVAKDLGLQLGADSMKKALVSQLKDGMQSIDLLVRVMQVFQPKEFEKNGKKGKLCNLVVADSTGETRLTVWHDDVDIVLRKGVKRGSVLQLKNCYVKEFNGRVQVGLAYNGSIEVNPKEISFEKLPAANSAKAKVSELKEGMNDVNLAARVLRIFPAKEFERTAQKAGGKGSVVNFLVADETGTVRATAWNDLVNQVALLKENDLVEIEGAYTKQGLKGIELHLGWQARMQKMIGAASGIPKAEEMLKKDSLPKEIGELEESGAMVLVKGKIAAVNPGRLYYSVCPKCGAKVQLLDEGAACEKCGEVKEPEARAIISVRIEDGTGQISAVAYGKEAEKIIGLEKEEMVKQAAERGSEAMIEELQALAGKEITVVGKVKGNSFSGEKEIRANLVEIAE